MMHSALSGLGLGFSLILAIGAQNAFVLRQGLRRAHVLPVIAICILSDAILIAAGVAGFGALAQAAPGLEFWMRLFGATFLGWYGLRSLWAAWQGGQSLQASEGAQSLRAAVVTCLALTWLNPHVYLDSLVVVGAVSADHDAVPFAIGTIMASVLFFPVLGYGARALAPIFARPISWQVLDVIVGVTMLVIAASLIVV